ncbi:hypothetical protein [Spongiactinospora sp. TRM90649]|uniref:hypothetical protein n=1 Tax=Spongiactinospora sp. TRM90649 TaxID=3031114 RepID=UPI003211ABCC
MALRAHGTDHRNHDWQNAAIAAYICWHNQQASPKVSFAAPDLVSTSTSPPPAPDRLRTSSLGPSTPEGLAAGTT